MNTDENFDDNHRKANKTQEMKVTTESMRSFSKTTTRIIKIQITKTTIPLLTEKNVLPNIIIKETSEDKLEKDPEQIGTSGYEYYEC